MSLNLCITTIFLLVTRKHLVNKSPGSILSILFDTHDGVAKSSQMNQLEYSVPAFFYIIVPV